MGRGSNMPVIAYSRLSMAVEAAATSFGTFVFSQHPSTLFHKVLCHRWRPTCSGAQHMWSAQARCLWTPARARLNSSGQPMCDAVCRVLLCSVHAMTHGTHGIQAV